MGSYQHHPPPPGPRCLATLEQLEAEGLSLAAQHDLAGGRFRFPARVDLVRPQIREHRRDRMQRMSISGMQDKISMRLHRGRLDPVDSGGTHILKPIPTADFDQLADTPANEALTMLLARQAGITTAASGLVRLADDELTYVTRRFDRPLDGPRLFQEDFGVLSHMTAETHGVNWKYSSTYEQLGHLVRRYCSMGESDTTEFLRRVIFCFVVGNGDAHIRNFSILREADGFVRLSPAYDLLCTRVHLPNDSDLALGLLAEEANGVFSAAFERCGFYTGADFLQLGHRLGLPRARVEAALAPFLASPFLELAHDLIGRSFLSVEGQVRYRATVSERVRMLAYELDSTQTADRH